MSEERPKGYPGRALRTRIPGEPDDAMDKDDPRRGVGTHRRFLIATGEAAQQGVLLEIYVLMLRQHLSRALVAMGGRRPQGRRDPSC